jgi:TIR domain
MNANTFDCLHQFIEFGCTILIIPTLDEMGIPLSGLSLVKPNEAWGRYVPIPETCWINRGDLLLTYNFRFFASESAPRFPFLKDPLWTRSYEIVSPISGLQLSMRDEQTIDFMMGLQYQWCSERALPVILVPNDEPPPDTHNFYVYDRIAQLLTECFDRLPIRYHSRTSSERLQDWLHRSDSKERVEFYHGCRTKIRERSGEDYRSYEIREISGTDREIIQNVQYLRTKNLDLRQKLVHLARKYGDSIGNTHPTTKSKAAANMRESTFISYGHPDEAFAQKLNQALRIHGVPTFFFKDDAAPGAKLHRVMRDGVNQYDRVILICSINSLNRPGLLNELEETLAREARDGGAEYLIPIRLDDYVFNGWNPKKFGVAQAVRDRVVADFRDPSRFESELAKLIAVLTNR